MPEHIADLPDKLRVGQTKAITSLIDYFDERDRGILWMCCGSGKTVACAIDIELRSEPVTVVFTPYIHLVKQWRDDYLKWLPTTQAKFMCVCSEKDTVQEIGLIEAGRLLNAAKKTSAEEFYELVEEANKSRGQTTVSTDPEEVASFLKQRGRKVIFCTYASSDVYGEAQQLAGIHANYGIFDEAQWTATGDKNSVSTFALHDANVKIDKRLFTTATVRHYTRSGKIYSMDNEQIYGRHVLVDKDGNPDPWTIRQAVEHNEVAPYRIVFSFVTDPLFDPTLVQLPPYQDLTIDWGNQADPSEVLRLVGHAMVIERVKAKYGVKKPLGFYTSVASARLATEILNLCKERPEHFPHLSKSDAAVSISTYESLGERRKRIAHLHNSPETEVNNARLFLFGADEPTIDAIFFGDSLTSDINVIQASGRAQRYAPGKVSTITVPVMVPHYSGNLDSQAQLTYKFQIQEAFRKLVDILDSLADMDPLLRDEMIKGSGRNKGVPGIIEFDFPDSFVPELQKAIEVETWRTINPETDFLDRLERDAQSLNRYRLHKFPTQEDPTKEAVAVEKRAAIRILPLSKNSIDDVAARRMWKLRRDIKSYLEAEKKDGRYGDSFLTAYRVEQVLRIYEWDEKYIMQDDFEEDLKKDAVALESYRLEKFPKRDDLSEETKAAQAREEIRLIPYKKGFETSAYRMQQLRLSMRGYFEANETDGTYNGRAITEKRAAQICEYYGWDKVFIMQDDFEEILKQDAVALEAYRLKLFPRSNDLSEEAKAAHERAGIMIIPYGHGLKTISHRMAGLRRSIRSYFEAGEIEGKYKAYYITAKRVQQVFQIYGWNRDFIFQDDFREGLKKDIITLNEYRLKIFPVQDDPEKEAEAVKARAAIKIMLQRAGYTNVANRMGHLRLSLRAYYDSGEQEGKYVNFVITPIRAQQIYEIYGWDKEFVMRDEFEERLKQDMLTLEEYRLQKFPVQDDSQNEAEAAKARAAIKIIPYGEGLNVSARRMWEWRQDLKAYYENGEQQGTYKSRFVDASLVNRVRRLYKWDKAFILQDDFEENLKIDAAELAKYRLQIYPQCSDPEEEAKAVSARAEIRILRKGHGVSTTSLSRMNHLFTAVKDYFESGEKEGSYRYFSITPKRVEQIFKIYGWDKNYIVRDDFVEALRRGAAALEKFRLEKYPKCDEIEEEERAAKLRDQIRILPKKFHIHGIRMVDMLDLRSGIKRFYESGEKEGKYERYAITAERVQQVFRILGWDKNFILKDDFEEDLKQDALNLEKYRFEKYPVLEDIEEETKSAMTRAQIKIVPLTKGHETTARRMLNLRKSIRAYFEAGEVDGSYFPYYIDAKRVGQVFRIYDWDKEFILQDEFLVALKQDVSALEKYRLEEVPLCSDVQEEARSSALRAEIKIISRRTESFRLAADRMQSLRREIKAYFENGEKEGRYGGHTLTTNRVHQVLDTFGWTREFVCSDVRWTRTKGNRVNKRYHHAVFSISALAPFVERPRHIRHHPVVLQLLD